VAEVLLCRVMTSLNWFFRWKVMLTVLPLPVVLKSAKICTV
jgi:hypothetical protein